MSDDADYREYERVRAAWSETAEKFAHGAEESTGHADALAAQIEEARRDLPRRIADLQQQRQVHLDTAAAVREIAQFAEARARSSRPHMVVWLAGATLFSRDAYHRVNALRIAANDAMAQAGVAVEAARQEADRAAFYRAWADYTRECRILNDLGRLMAAMVAPILGTPESGRPYHLEQIDLGWPYEEDPLTMQKPGDPPQTRDDEA